VTPSAAQVNPEYVVPVVEIGDVRMSLDEFVVVVWM
jgi:hypothetical protein